jgi:hypothetical protein
MRYKIFGHILLLCIVAFSFTAPLYSPYAYEFCPSKPENGFICYCAYKGSSDKTVDIVYSSSAKKQISPEKFNSMTLLAEEPFVFIATVESDAIEFQYNIFYKDISQKAPDKPPAV